MTKQKILGLGAGFVLVSLTALAFTLHSHATQMPKRTGLEPLRTSSADELKLSNNKFVAGKNEATSAFSDQRERVDEVREINFARSYNERVFSRTSSQRSVQQGDVGVMQTDPELEYPHTPLAFLNYSGVLPQTPEVEAAIQHLQQDFINATGATTANPADPVFAQRWELEQPTADEIYYAQFGIEAFNALSITEARARGHL